MPVEQTLYGIYIVTIHVCMIIYYKCLIDFNISYPSIVLEKIELETSVTVEDDAAVYQRYHATKILDTTNTWSGMAGSGMLGREMGNAGT